MATQTVTLGYGQQQETYDVVRMLANKGFIPAGGCLSGSLTLTFSKGAIASAALVDVKDPANHAFTYTGKGGDNVEVT